MMHPIPQAVQEIDYSPRVIKLLTPYLNDIIENPNETGHKPRLLTMRHRALCWYYCFNNHNKSDAFKRAYYATYNSGKGVLIFDTERIQSVANLPSKAASIFIKQYIKEAVYRIEKEVESQLKKNLPTDLLRQMIIQATYDPSMFITASGGPSFKTWDDIPQEYRCCVEGIDTKAYGKNADVTIRTLKLIDREKSRKYLLQMCPGLMEPETHKHIHSTIDDDGKEIGFNFNKMTTNKLLELLKEMERDIR